MIFFQVIAVWSYSLDANTVNHLKFTPKRVESDVHPNTMAKLQKHDNQAEIQHDTQTKMNEGFSSEAEEKSSEEGTRQRYYCNMWCRVCYGDFMCRRDCGPVCRVTCCQV